MSRKVSVIIKRPGGKPYKTNISVSLKNLQNTVGGFIEIVTLCEYEGITFIVNARGLSHGLLYNCTVCGVELYGTVIVIGVKGDEFDDIPITLAQAKKLFPQMWEDGRS